MKVSLLPEFVFKDTGERPPRVDVLDRTHYQWAGFIQFNHMLATIPNHSNKFSMFSHAGFAIYVLDDYSVHLMPEIKGALRKKGYILVIIGEGIIGFVQVNDTHLHKELKKEYRKLEYGKTRRRSTKNTISN